MLASYLDSQFVTNFVTINFWIISFCFPTQYTIPLKPSIAVSNDYLFFSLVIGVFLAWRYRELHLPISEGVNYTCKKTENPEEWTSSTILQYMILIPINYLAISWISAQAASRWLPRTKWSRAKSTCSVSTYRRKPVAVRVLKLRPVSTGAARTPTLDYFTRGATWFKLYD